MEFNASSFLDNSPNKIKIKKLQDTMIIAGKGIIAFAFWNVLKNTLMLIINRKFYVMEMCQRIIEMDAVEADHPHLGDIALFTIIILLVVYLGVGVLIRCYIGLSAISEGRGKRHGIAYLILTAIFIISTISEIFGGTFGFFQSLNLDSYSTFMMIANGLLDITNVVILVEMIYSAVMLRKLRKQTPSDDPVDEDHQSIDQIISGE